MRSLFDRILYGGSTKLRAYETAVLDAVEAALPQNWKGTLGEQRKLFDLIQRTAEDRMVAFFFRKVDPPLFERKDEEFRVAVAETKESPRFRCTVVLHAGRLSSLEFSKSPRGLDTSPSHFEVTIHPSLVAGAGVGELHSGPRLAELRSKITVTDVQPPSAASAASEPFGVNAALPEDLQALLQETDGFSTDGFTFLGSRPRSIIRSDGNYLLFLEGNESGLCLREGEGVPMVFRYNAIDDDVTSVGSSFVEALTEIVGAHLRSRSD